MNSKHCTYCGKLYLATPDFFHRDKYAYDGLTARCKECRCMLERIRLQKIRRGEIRYD